MTKIERLDAWCAQNDHDVVLADGFDEALIGVARIFNTLVAVYDRSHCLAILQRREGMKPQDAEEFFEFNAQNSYVGAQTPAFLVWSAETIQ